MPKKDVNGINALLQIHSKLGLIRTVNPNPIQSQLGGAQNLTLYFYKV